LFAGEARTLRLFLPVRANVNIARLPELLRRGE
jgi:hypothetical protein